MKSDRRESASAPTPRSRNSPAERLAASLRARGAAGARLAIVLGSGLGAVAEAVVGALVIPFADLEGMPTGRESVPGHAARFVLGEVGGVRAIVQQGRAHIYEGFSAEEVSRSVRAFAALGIRGLLLTNAAGGLGRQWKPPDLMRVVDHVNLQGATSLLPPEAGRGSPYDEALGAALERGANDAGVALARGVYAGVLGPCYETPAEARMLEWLGADAVGMSTVCEAQAARAAGMRVAAVSCIANLPARIGGHSPSHEEVLSAGAEVARRLERLVERSAPHFAAALG